MWFLTVHPITQPKCLRFNVEFSVVRFSSTFRNHGWQVIHYGCKLPLPQLFSYEYHVLHAALYNCANVFCYDLDWSALHCTIIAVTLRETYRSAIEIYYYILRKCRLNLDQVVNLHKFGWKEFFAMLAVSAGYFLFCVCYAFNVS